MLSSLPYPLLFVTDCSERPPQKYIDRYLSPALLKYAANHPLEQNAVLWSRLLLLSIPYQQHPDDPPLMIVSDRFTKSLTLGGDSYHYCKTDWQGDNLALVVSDLPVFLSFKSFDSVNDHLKEIARLRFPAIINNWIDRQENSELAFYQYWTLSECLKDRDDPTVRIKIDDDDCLTVRGSSVLLRETFQFWTSEEWICSVQFFGDGVLIYTGIPANVVSVGHGPAYGKAGKGTADPKNLISSVEVLRELVLKKKT